MVENARLLQLLAEEKATVLAHRQWFHEHPELSGREQNTSEKIKSVIHALGIAYKDVGDYGLIARLDGAAPGKTVLLRADMDALPIAESKCNLIGEKSCVSTVEGISHACGHDAHMAITLGAMKLLNQLKPHWNGTVLFAFEQAEESGGGIIAMIQALAKYSIDGCYATHVYAGLSSGKISVQPGKRMAALTAFKVLVKGKGGHASRPDLTINPLMCTANILVNLNSLWTGEVDPTKTVTLGIGSMHCGEMGNVIADEATFSGSMRYYDVEEGEKAFESVKRVCTCVAEAHRCTVEFPLILQSKYAVYNDADCSARAQNGIVELFGAEAIGECDPWFATESMGIYLDRYPGVLAFLGIADEANGYGAGHHTKEFDLDEQILATGVGATVKYALDFLEPVSKNV